MRTLLIVTILLSLAACTDQREQPCRIAVRSLAAAPEDRAGGELKKVLAFEHGLHQHLKSSHAALLARLEADKALDKAAEEELSAAVAAFKKSFS